VPYDAGPRRRARRRSAAAGRPPVAAAESGSPARPGWSRSPAGRGVRFADEIGRRLRICRGEAPHRFSVSAS